MVFLFTEKSNLLPLNSKIYFLIIPGYEKYLLFASTNVAFVFLNLLNDFRLDFSNIVCIVFADSSFYCWQVVQFLLQIFFSDFFGTYQYLIWNMLKLEQIPVWCNNQNSTKWHNLQRLFSTWFFFFISITRDINLEMMCNFLRLFLEFFYFDHRS